MRMDALDALGLTREDMCELVKKREARIAELEAALDEIRGAAFPLSTARNGLHETMCVPIGAWDNAMRAITQ